jgi:cobaltochelatase CobT
MLDDEARAQTAPRPANALAQTAATQAHASPLRQALDAAPEEHASSLGELTRTAVNAKGREAPALNVALARASSSRLAPHAAAGANFAPEVRAATNALRHRLGGLLQAETLCRRYPALTGRRLDTRRLGRMEGGEARLFLREMAGFQTDTAVQILLDRSGSMGASRGREWAGTPRPIEVARAACYATALALQPVPGIAVAAAAFPGRSPGEMTVLADFHERVDRQVARFASLEAGGGTPLAEAMLWGASELLGQPQARRIVLLATDGAYDTDLGRAMTARLLAGGIEILGIGIHCDLSHLGLRSRRVVTITDLPQAMFELLLEALRCPVGYRRPLRA